MRINFGDDFGSVITKMAEGNPGALKVLFDLCDDGFKRGQSKASIFYLVNLDILCIYGSDIWRLYKDVCKENLQEMILLLEDYQNKKFSREEIYKKLNT